MERKGGRVSVTYLKEQARDFAIREALRLETQATGMAGQAAARADETALVADRLASLEAEVAKVKGIALDAIAKARQAARDFEVEAASLATLRRQLEADRAAGKPFMIEITVLP